METGFKYAKLVLDEPRAIYYSGQLLSGHIECELTQPLNFTSITVTYTGEAVVEWTEWEREEYNGVSRDKQVPHKGYEQYFNVSQCILGGQFVTHLQAGKHTVPFQYQIPHNVPSSFVGERGRVKYIINAYIDYPDPNMPRDELSQEFEVIAPMDLNEPDINVPIEIDFEEYYSCCCSSTPMTLHIRCPVSGYCPGQLIPIHVSAKNESNVEVKKITFELVRRETFRSHHPASEYSPPDEVLETVQTGAILSNTTREVTYNLRVPDMIAPNMDNCDIIDIGFALLVTVKLSGCNDDLEDESDICISLVPIAGTPGAEGYKHPMTHSLPNAPIPVPPPAGANPNPQVATSYPNSNAGFPNQANQGYPSPNQGYTNANPGYPNANTGYPNANPGYPNANPGYPNANPGYPNANPGYPNANMGHTPYQPANTYPNTGAPFPNPNPPYPNQDSIPLRNLPVQNVGFVMPPSGVNPPYPGGNMPYPAGNMPNYGQSYPPTSPTAPPPS